MSQSMKKKPVLSLYHNSQLTRNIVYKTSTLNMLEGMIATLNFGTVGLIDSLKIKYHPCKYKVFINTSHDI